MTYTGYTYEYLLENLSRHDGWDTLLDLTDILVDGKYESSKRNILLKFRGSENQRIIDVKRSKMENKIVLVN